MEDDFWKAVREKEKSSAASRRTGALNIALLFGTAVVALTLILTPMLAEKTKPSVFASVPGDFDSITTGSVPPAPSSGHFTVRRSVLDDDPTKGCIVEGYRGDRDC